MQLLGPRGWQQGELAWGGPGQLPALSEQGSLAQGKSTGRRGSLACPSPWGLGSQCSSEHIWGRVGHSWAGPRSWTLPTTSRASLISKAAWATCGGPHWGDRQVGPPNASSRSATQVPPTPSSTAKARGCQESGTRVEGGPRHRPVRPSWRLLTPGLGPGSHHPSPRRRPALGSSSQQSSDPGQPWAR